MSNPLNNPYLETRLLREVCRNSFYQFCREFAHLFVPNEITWNWHHEYLCQKFQEVSLDVLEGRPKRGDLIVSIAPGTMKSSLLSILLPAYLHAINPRFRFITASFDYKLACLFSRQTRIVMNSPLYQKLFHKFTFSPDRQGEYVNQFGGSRLCFSTGQSPTGRHANMIIIDDPVAPTLVDREDKIQETSFWMNAVIRPRVADVLSTPLILVMQRLHPQDPVGEWLENAKTHPDAKLIHISLPAEMDADHKPVPRGLALNYQNGLLDPNRLGHEALKDRQTWMSDADYKAQYLQAPIVSEGLMFKVANINVRQIDPLDPIVRLIRYWDKAISVSDTACYTAGVKLGMTRSGRWWVIDVRRGKWGLYDRENMIRSTAESDGLPCMVAVEQEPGPIYEEEYVLTWDKDLWYPTQKKLMHVQIGDDVINQHGNPTKVTDVHIQGTLPIMIIETTMAVLDETGNPISYQKRQIRAHESHPFAVGSGWVNAGDLIDGVRLKRMCFGKINETFYTVYERVDAIRPAVVPMRCRCLTVEEGESFVVNDIVVHNSGGKESALNTVRNLAGFNVMIDPASAAKEVRARPLAIQVEQGNVYCVPASWNDTFFSELAGFPHAKYKDQVDAFVGGFNCLARQQNLVATAF